MSDETKIFVCCPANWTTGGPEALHALVDALRRQGFEAYISYYSFSDVRRPFSDEHVTPSPYRHYDVAARMPEDAPNSVIIVPESMTFVLRSFMRAQHVVWWLSIDFYFGWKRDARILDMLRYARRRLTGKCTSLAALRGARHFAQSEFAAAFLRERGIHAAPLSDYLNDELLVDPPQLVRSPTILYNPKKGMQITRKLIAACPKLQFRPLVGLGRAQLREVIASSMVYIDFGNHPGKDRMPREAAVGGCVVITNRQGSAGFARDIAIPERYKINDARRGFVDEFRALVHDVVADFDRCRLDFGPYVAEIRTQRRVFFEEARALATSVAARVVAGPTIVAV
jgi:hypothetical protein